LIINRHNELILRKKQHAVTTKKAVQTQILPELVSRYPAYSPSGVMDPIPVELNESIIC